jgi:hypothetical protein
MMSPQSMLQVTCFERLVRDLRRGGGLYGKWESEQSAQYSHNQLDAWEDMVHLTQPPSLGFGNCDEVRHTQLYASISVIQRFIYIHQKFGE